MIGTSSSVISVCFISKGANQETGSALNYYQLPVTFSASNMMQSQHLFSLWLICSSEIHISYISASSQWDPPFSTLNSSSKMLPGLPSLSFPPSVSQKMVHFSPWSDACLLFPDLPLMSNNLSISLCTYLENSIDGAGGEENISNLSSYFEPESAGFVSDWFLLFQFGFFLACLLFLLT